MRWLSRLTRMAPLERRKWITVVSGGLIAAAIGAGAVLAWDGARTALMLAATLLAGSDVAARAWNALRVRHVGIELLVTVAAVGALIIGDVWEAAAVTFLFALGGYLETRTLAGTRSSIEALLEVAPDTAVVLRDGEREAVPAGEVEEGEVVLVKPGAKVPVDGEVVDGFGTVDESAVTGESMPAEKGPEATVLAGTVSQSGLLRVRATGVGADTTLARVIRRVEEAQEEKATAQRFMERFASRYTPAIIVLAVGAFAVSGDAALALTLLVIACPGALVISIPVSVVAGIGRAAREGILIKGGQHLETVGRISTVALDKTGTVTQGRPRVTEVMAFRRAGAPASAARGSHGGAVPDRAAEAEMDGGNRPEAAICTVTDPGSAGECEPSQQEVLRTAAIAENGSNHPLARPILRECEPLGEVPEAEGLEEVAGHGLRARHDGSRIEVGSEAAMEAWGVDLAADERERIHHLKAQGRTVAVVALDGAPLGLIALADPLRPEVREALDALRRQGVERMVLLTGDDPRTARSVAEQLGVDEVHAGLLPEDKLARIRALQERGETVAMVGDGINDAPALARADVGVAMGAAGTDAAIETADVALMADDLRKLPRAVGLSRSTVANMRQNLVLALFTVAGLLTGVLMGEVHMAGGMLVHEASVLAVVLNGMRLMRA